MSYSTEVQLVLDSLNKDKRVFLDKVAEIDKVIKRIKYGNLDLGLNNPESGETPNEEEAKTQAPQAFPLKADVRIKVIKIFDLLGVASRLQDIEGKYQEITGTRAKLKETLRNLNKHEILKLIKPKNAERSLYWVKTEWLEEDNTKLKEQHKFEGFDLIYTDEMIEFK